MGAGLSPGGATIIDGSDMIVLPGLVDTDLHCWNTIARSLAGDQPSLPDGACAMQCFFPDDEDGIPHVFEGMHEVVALN